MGIGKERDQTLKNRKRLEAEMATPPKIQQRGFTLRTALSSTKRTLNLPVPILHFPHKILGATWVE